MLLYMEFAGVHQKLLKQGLFLPMRVFSQVKGGGHAWLK